METKILVVSGFPDRRPSLLENLKEHGVSEDQVTFIDAPTGDGWRQYDYLPSPYWRDKRTPKLRSNGHQCCEVGHVLAWEQVVALDCPCVILEDDARLTAPIPEIPERHFVSVNYLGYKRMADWPDRAITNGWRKAPLCWWAVGYQVSPTAAKILLEGLGGFLIPTDEYLPAMCGLGVTEDRLGLALRGTNASKKMDAWCLAEPIVTPSGVETQTETYDCAFNLKVLLLGTDQEKLNPLTESLRERGFDVDQVGVGEEGWDTSKEGGRQKFEWLRRYFGDITCNDHWNTIFLVMDGYDTEIFRSSPRAILRVYGSLRWPCVVSGERNYWPKRHNENAFAPREYDDDDEQGGSASPYNYPCSGLFIGTSDDLMDGIGWALDRYPDEVDDQALMQQIVLQQPEIWRVDDGGSLFMSMSKSEDDIGPDGVNKVTGTFPRVYHANGNSKMPECVVASVSPENEHRQALRFAGTPAVMLQVANDIVAIPLLTPDEINQMLAFFSSLKNEDWAPFPGDDVPGDEYRSPEFFEDLSARIMSRVPSLINTHWPMLNWEISDIFAIRHSGAGQVSLRLHNDISLVSGSMKILNAQEGGALWFPRQNFSDEHIEPGCSIWWPSRVSHPHTVTPVKNGQRLAVTIWTKG